MRGRAAWVMGLLAAALVALRALGRRRAVDEAVEAPVAPPPDAARADELRRKLAESRELVQERDAFEEGELPVDRADAEEDADARRQQVHEEGRAAVDEMREAQARGGASGSPADPPDE